MAKKSTQKTPKDLKKFIESVNKKSKPHGTRIRHAVAERKKK